MTTAARIRYAQPSRFLRTGTQGIRTGGGLLSPVTRSHLTPQRPQALNNLNERIDEMRQAVVVL
jgi:hypothetical protein